MTRLAEIAALVSHSDYMGVASAEVERYRFLLAEIDRLRRYVQHHVDCRRYRLATTNAADPLTCSCGLEAG